MLGKRRTKKNNHCWRIRNSNQSKKTREKQLIRKKDFVADDKSEWLKIKSGTSFTYSPASKTLRIVKK